MDGRARGVRYLSTLHAELTALWYIIYTPDERYHPGGRKSCRMSGNERHNSSTHSEVKALRPPPLVPPAALEPPSVAASACVRAVRCVRAWGMAVHPI
jgi:hypothetical protein